ncbi:TetR/AcrR family transcriptional regulator C-terminal ligand-binding domain-containing protein [Streptomyces maoxianensis]|uniref:TetR/AcrR family transcriptional regulator C-terminal ligand-binding domain-containing protein n=1 Tax=Streptomyces maoxianensis TaxID=1459942 RepID=A0ABV9GC15_9ACTN
MCVAAGVVRGEYPGGTDAQEVIRAVPTPLHYRFVAGGEPLDDAAVVALPQLAESAARAGDVRALKRTASGPRAAPETRQGSDPHRGPDP